MDKAYSRIVWQNQPSTATALGATNLNKVDVALNSIDDRVVGMDTSKANQSTVNGVVQSITFNDATGVLTVTKVNGTSTNIDTKLEKLAVNFAYNPTTQQLDITLDDGTVQHVDMSALVTQYEFDNTGTIAFTLTGGRITANVVNGSITAEKLHPDYLANLTVQAQIAEENKNIAIEQAGIATDAADDAETYRDQALQYRNEAEGIVGVGIATESVPGLVKGAGNVSVRSNGDMWADPYKDKATLSGPSVQFPTADNGLIEITNIIGKSSVTPEDPLLPISPDNIATIHNVGDVPFEFRATGKNLFDGGLELGDFSPTTGAKTASTTIIRSINKIKVIPGTSYTLSSPNSLIAKMAWWFYRADGSFILREVSNQTRTVTVPSDCHYMAFRTFSADFSLITIGMTNIQLELGSTSTPYEPYKGNQTPVSDTYGALPDGTYDERTPEKDIKRKGIYIITATDIASINTTGTNMDYAVMRYTNMTGVYLPPGGDSLGTTILTNMSVPRNGATFDTASMHYKHWFRSTDWAIAFPKGKYATLADAKAAFTGMVVHYKLSTPIESPRDRIFLTSYPGITNVYTTDPLQPTFTAVAKSELWSKDYLINLGIKALQDGKIDKTALTGQSSTNDANKVPSSQVTHDLQTQITQQNNNLPFLNPLINKKLAFLGDSICFGYGWNVEDGTWTPKGWSYIIKENNPSCTVQNISVSSATLTNALADNNILMQAESLITNKATFNPDYILLQGGINDRNAGAPIGKAGTSFYPTNDSTYLSTVSGAVDYMLYRLINNFPNARIGFISSTRCLGGDYQPILDAIHKVCNKWCIPVLDLWNNGELNPYIDAINTQYYYQADGVHPKEIGYRRFIAPKIEKWIKSEMFDSKMILSSWITVGTGDKNNSYTINTNLDRYTEICIMIGTPDHYYNNFTIVIPTCAIFSFGRFENMGNSIANIQLNLSLTQISMSVCTIEGVSYLDNAYDTSLTVYAK